MELKKKKSGRTEDEFVNEEGNGKMGIEKEERRRKRRNRRGIEEDSSRKNVGRREHRKTEEYRV